MQGGWQVLLRSQAAGGNFALDGIILYASSLSDILLPRCHAGMYVNNNLHDHYTLTLAMGTAAAHVHANTSHHHAACMVCHELSSTCH